MPRKLQPEELERYQQLLLQAYSVLSGDIDELESDALSDDGERLSVDNPADIGSDRFAQEFSLELLQKDEQTLAEVHAALARIEKGKFGKCETCSKPIPKARLNAMPHARNCIDCQRAIEQAL